jgi:hypothetical protein
MNVKKQIGRLEDFGGVTRTTKGGLRGYVDAERTLQPIAGLSGD